MAPLKPKPSSAAAKRNAMTEATQFMPRSAGGDSDEESSDEEVSFVFVLSCDLKRDKFVRKSMLQSFAEILQLSFI